MPFLKRRLLNAIIAILLYGFFSGCSDPVEPKFEFKEGLVYVDALVTDMEEASYVRVFESVLDFGVNKNVFINNAQITFVNLESGAVIDLLEDDDIYVPPLGFSPRVGEQWAVQILLPDGREYRSEPDLLPNPVDITEIKIAYDPELSFQDSYNGLVPGHSIAVSFDDPLDEENYYYWRFKSFEKLVYCKECFGAIFRNGECETNPPVANSGFKPRYTYACEIDCWKIRYSDKIEIFHDEFTNGKTTTELQVGEVLLFTKDNILVQLQQFSISAKAYQYLKTLKDLVDNNSGFNSPLPAALLGNMYNVNDKEEFVLGRFTAASASTKSVFIERIFIEEDQLEARIINSPEEDEVPPPIVITAPCQESRTRTSIMPNDWMY